ncbi:MULTISPECIES: hypothetical protein [Rhodobacterales]|uniref:Tetratricopeptide repeat protein n=1 Tax=Parasulfitobacter algicola TaxID=2614809 RepID=A0ABX2IQW0_9RHOB|nr:MULTISPECIES: hypothetical protein [Rhodobacterales]NSX55262.1 hypothetical protein [Sulfitobacter algicola]
MVRKPEIEGPLRIEIDSILQRSGKAYQENNLELSLKLGIEAWNIIPDPKSHWDYYPQSLSTSFVEDFSRLGKVSETKKWINTVYEMYGDPDRQDHYTLMIEGSALYKLGLKEEAYDVFGRIYELYDRDGFKGEHLEYLEFYLKERAKRRG